MMLERLKEKLRPKIEKELARPAPVPGEKLWQEFYCATSGQGCGGYFMVRINTAINGVVKVKCPNCGHEHGRIIEDGHIRENWNKKTGAERNSETSQELIVPKSAFSKTPRTLEFLKGIKTYNERTCAIVSSQDQIANAMLRQSWAEKHGVK